MRELGKKDLVDAAADPDDLYDESRVAFLSARREVEPGMLVAVEWTRKESASFPRFFVALQDRLPVVTARVTVAVPEGWRVEGVAFDHATLAPRAAGTRTAWEVSGLPWRPREPLAPISSATPRLAVSVFPAPGEGSALPAFTSWGELGRWTASLMDPAAVPDAALAAKAREMGGGAGATTPREKLDAAARAVQALTYVSVQTDLARGGGYRPRAAADTLRHGYGDCKDKVTLLRALLSALGVASRPVLVCATDAGFPRREWPSPSWFDHVVVGVAGAAREGEPVIEAAGEKLLLFDPTDPFTPVGQLPEALWGGLALVAAPEGSALVTVPSGHARLERRVTGDVNADGSFKARLVESGSGARAESLRALARRATPEELKRAVEAWLSSAIPGVVVGALEQKGNAASPSLEVELSGRLPGTQSAGSLVVLRPVLVPWRGLPALPAKERRLPIALPPRDVVSEVTLRLPGAFAVSELPAPVKIERPFGRFAMTMTESEGTLTVRQELRLEGGSVPAADYAAARELVTAALAARDAAVVLKRRY